MSHRQQPWFNIDDLAPLEDEVVVPREVSDLILAGLQEEHRSAQRWYDRCAMQLRAARARNSEEKTILVIRGIASRAWSRRVAAIHALNELGQRTLGAAARARIEARACPSGH